MRLRSLLVEAGPWPPGVAPAAIATRIEARWRGSLTFMTVPAAHRRWRADHRDPRGAAEHLAADIERAILDGGGTVAHVERVLIACMTAHLYI